MAIITRAAITTRSTVTYTGADATAIEQFCTDVDAAIKAMLKPYYPEPYTATMYLDAPPSRNLVSEYRPIRSITSVHFRAGANGDPSLFTSDYLLTNYTDYYLETDAITGRNEAGMIYRTGGNIWGYDLWSPPDMLGYRIEPNYKAVKVIADVGPAAVPADIANAAYLAVLLMYQWRTTGIPVTSSSWNGASRSLSQQYTADGAIRTPGVLALLAPYTSLSGYSFHVG